VTDIRENIERLVDIYEKNGKLRQQKQNPENMKKIEAYEAEMKEIFISLVAQTLTDLQSICQSLATMAAAVKK
jgi:hypothetical protein